MVQCMLPNLGVCRVRARALILREVADQVVPPEAVLRPPGSDEWAGLHLFAKCVHWVQIERRARLD